MGSNRNLHGQLLELPSDSGSSPNKQQIETLESSYTPGTMFGNQQGLTS